MFRLSVITVLCVASHALTSVAPDGKPASLLETGAQAQSQLQVASQIRTAQGLRMMKITDQAIIDLTKDVKKAQSAVDEITSKLKAAVDENDRMALQKDARRNKMDLMLAQEALNDMNKTENWAHGVLDAVPPPNVPSDEEMDSMMKDFGASAYMQMSMPADAEIKPQSLVEQKQALEKKAATVMAKSSKIDSLVQEAMQVTGPKDRLTAAQHWANRERRIEHQNGHGKAQVDYDWNPMNLIQKLSTPVDLSLFKPEQKSTRLNLHSKAVHQQSTSSSDEAADKPAATKPSQRRGPNWEKYNNKKA